ncbi:hypothetical protein [Methylocystis parvus]|uniref:hypothetical protein n=1 Tax=Methylocystis parvus TaxID=134 RepID=UPI003C78695C
MQEDALAKPRDVEIAQNAGESGDERAGDIGVKAQLDAMCRAVAHEERIEQRGQHQIGRLILVERGVRAVPIGNERQEAHEIERQNQRAEDEKASADREAAEEP